MTFLMSRWCLSCALVLSILLFSHDSARAQGAQPVQPDRVQVYYFYTSSRCPNCYNMENWTREVVSKDFAGEMAAGAIAFSTVNMEAKGSEHFVEEYRLYTKAIILVVMKDGKEARFENLIKVWEYLNDKERFKQYVKDAITKALRELA